MIWRVCFALSFVVLTLSLIYAATAARKYSVGRFLGPFQTIFVGVFAAVFIGLIPPLSEMLGGNAGQIASLLLIDLLDTIQVFTINIGADLILDNIGSAAEGLSGSYAVYMFILFCAAPVLTFGFIISLFQNLVAEIRYLFHFRGEVYAFSELNEKALALAESIRRNHRDALITFAGVDRSADDDSGFLERARELDAVCFRKEIDAIRLERHGNKKQLNLFAIGSDDSESLLQALRLVERYSMRENTSLYVFSTGTEGELLLSGSMDGCLKIRRVNEVRSLVYRFLHDDGYSVFKNALPASPDCRRIKAVIVGLGRYGTEMLKALTWFCQMDGYTVELHAFDKDELAWERFAARCPELVGGGSDGSPYDIHIHAGVDVTTKCYADEIAALKGVTFALVCLGNDRDNITHAVDLRMLFERNGSKPVIKSVVYNTDEIDALSGITNYRGQAYDVDFIGGLESSCSEEVIINSELEKLALARHLKWGTENEFWRYEYNYRSSMASAVHMKARIACGIPGADKREEDLTPAEEKSIALLEHRRWNAYMRAEGYVYSGSPDKASRNDLAKMHHDLIPFDQLTEEDKHKDIRVGTQ